MVEWTADSPGDGPPQPRMPERTLPSGPPGKIREYWICLVLSIVTLGVYGLWYHWVMHRELCDYLGRPVREKPIWITYLVLYIGMFSIIGAFVVMVVGAGLSGIGDEIEGIAAVLAGMLLLIGVFFLAVIAAVVLFIVYVVKQFKVLTAAKQALGLPSESAANRFLGFYVGGVVASMFVGFVGTVLQAVAYWFMHEEYTQIWWHVRSLNIEKGYVGVGAQVPEGEV